MSEAAFYLAGLVIGGLIGFWVGYTRRKAKMGSKDMNCDGCGYYYCKCQVVIRTTSLHDLQAENARLRAELEALKPKPVVRNCLYGVEINPSSINGKYWPEFTAGAGLQNLELTFHDGKLVSAKVKNDKGEWV